MKLSSEGSNLVSQYEIMFQDTAAKRFSGGGWNMIRDWFLEYIKPLKTFTLLDYGSGTADQVFIRLNNWKGKLFHESIDRKCQCYYCYDPAVEKFAKPPSIHQKFDIVMCLEVMEHVLEQDIPAVLQQLNNYCADNGAIFLTISGSLSSELLPDGRNSHVTVKPRDWWDQVLKENLKKKYFMIYHTIKH